MKIPSFLKSKFKSRRNAIISLLILIPLCVLISLFCFEFVYNRGIVSSSHPQESILPLEIGNYLFLVVMGSFTFLVGFPIGFYEFVGLAKNAAFASSSSQVEVYFFIHPIIAFVIYWIVFGGLVFLTINKRSKFAYFLVFILAVTAEMAHTKNADCVLIVDDEQSFLRSIKRLLSQMGYSVLHASGGEEALEIYKQNHKEISLVMLDILMPDMDGIETFSRIREIDSGAKVLLCSGYSRDENVDCLLDSGAVGFIQKPFDYRLLSSKVSTAINQNKNETVMS